eukprot:6755744-Prymnesium_polylepis.1
MRWACGTRRALSALRDGSEVAQGCADDDMTPHHYPAQLRDWHSGDCRKDASSCAFFGGSSAHR